jgi:aspartate beta-hydroxylase
VRLQEIRPLLQRAAVARQQGHRDEERRSLEAVLAIDVAHPQALNALGMIALAEARHQDAASLFTRAADADPKEPALWMNVATAHRAMRDDSGELVALDRALDIDRLHFMALLRKAELHERRQENGPATRTWEGTLAVSRSMPDLPPAIVDRLADARRFVEDQTRALAEAVDYGLADEWAGLMPSERRRSRACIDKILGRREIYTNQCAGLHFPFLPADEFFDREHFPWMAQIEARTDAIAAELASVLRERVGLKPYVHPQPGVPDNIWTGLAGSLDWGAVFLWEYGRRNEAVCALCPETVAALEAVPQTEIPRRAPTAFFSLLKPHTHIPPHTGVTNTRTIIHLPLVVPPDCSFRVGGETRDWRRGEAIAFDDTIEHEAWNRSDELRAVLIFDVWNPHMTEAERRMVKRFFEISDVTGHSPEG